MDANVKPELLGKYGSVKVWGNILENTAAAELEILN